MFNASKIAFEIRGCFQGYEELGHHATKALSIVTNAKLSSLR